MASSGSFNTSGYSGRYLTFSWSVASQNIANNQTTINWNLKGAGGSTNTYYKAGNFAVVIDGATVYASATRINLYNGTLVASGSYTITHNADGNRSFSASAQAGIYTVAVNCSGSGSWALPQIPRQANITSAPDFNDTQNLTIGFNNPGGFRLNARLEFGGTSISRNNIPNTGSYTFQFTEAERNLLRSKCPNSNTLTVREVIATCISGTTENYWSFYDRTMTIVNANPTIGAIAYQDTNGTTTGITQNNQVIIQNNSSLQFNFSTLSALKYATLRTVAVTLNGVTKSANLSGSSASSTTINFGVVNSAQNLNASIVITDSRGNKSTYSKAITMWAWSLPSAIITCQRQNNFYDETSINVNADYSSLNGKNAIDIKFQYKKTTDATYSEAQSLQDDVTTQFSIDNEYAWNIKVTITDLLGTTTYNLFIDKGIPIVYFDRLNNSTGFNCFPKNQKSVEINGQDVMNMFVGIGGLCRSASTSDWNTACGSINGIYMGADMSNSPSGDTVANWWIVLHMAHNDLYQRQVAFSFLNNNGIYTRLKNNGTWNNWTQV